MKTIFTKGIIAIAIVALASSCSTSNDVASNRGIQKRKYNKGFFVSKNAKGLNHQNKDEQTKAVVIKEEVAEVINTQENVQNEVATEVKTTEVNNITAVETPVNNDNNTESFNDNTSKTTNNNSETIEDDVTENKIVTKKDVKKQIRNHKKQKDNSNSGSDVDLVVLVILAIFLPPLAVFLYEGATTRFWINLILTILLITAIIAVIHALLIVTGTI